MDIKHKFVARFNDDDDLQKYQGYNVDDNTIIKFYQLGSFQHPINKMYHLRRYIINGKNEFINIKDYQLDKRQFKKFTTIRKNNEYKLYPVYDLDMAGVPTYGDILLAKSKILSNDSNYSGFAPF